MPINSRQKGKRGELELCHALKGLFGWAAERSVQHCGNAGDSDLIVRGLPNLFVECKRVQSLNLPKAMALAVQQAGPDKTAVVFHRRDKEPWLLTCQLEDLMALCRIMVQAQSPTAQVQSGACSTQGTT